MGQELDQNGRAAEIALLSPAEKLAIVNSGIATLRQLSKRATETIIAATNQPLDSLEARVEILKEISVYGRLGELMSRLITVGERLGADMLVVLKPELIKRAEQHELLLESSEITYQAIQSYSTTPQQAKVFAEQVLEDLRRQQTDDPYLEMGYRFLAERRQQEAEDEAVREKDEQRKRGLTIAREQKLEKTNERIKVLDLIATNPASMDRATFIQLVLDTTQHKEITSQLPDEFGPRWRWVQDQIRRSPQGVLAKLSKRLREGYGTETDKVFVEHIMQIMQAEKEKDVTEAKAVEYFKHVIFPAWLAQQERINHPVPPIFPAPETDIPADPEYEATLASQLDLAKQLLAEIEGLEGNSQQDEEIVADEPGSPTNDVSPASLYPAPEPTHRHHDLPIEERYPEWIIEAVRMGLDFMMRKYRWIDEIPNRTIFLGSMQTDERVLKLAEGIIIPRLPDPQKHRGSYNNAKNSTAVDVDEALVLNALQIAYANKKHLNTTQVKQFRKAAKEILNAKRRELRELTEVKRRGYNI